jgi:hypothetical protein
MVRRALEISRVIATVIVTAAVLGGVFAAGTGALPAIQVSNTTLPGNLSVGGELQVAVAGENATANESVSLGDTPPAIEFVIANDSTDGDGIVSDGDTITISAAAVDSDTGIDIVTANASAFGVDMATLTEGVNGTYLATFTVDASTGAPNGSYPILIVANDTAGNTAKAKTNTLQLGTTTTCINDAVSGSDDSIGIMEIQTAINWWAEGTEVPDTGGETISLTKIQGLINAWSENAPVSC